MMLLYLRAARILKLPRVLAVSVGVCCVGVKDQYNQLTIMAAYHTVSQLGSVYKAAPSILLYIVLAYISASTAS